MFSLPASLSLLLSHFTLTLLLMVKPEPFYKVYATPEQLIGDPACVRYIAARLPLHLKLNGAWLFGGFFSFLDTAKIQCIYKCAYFQ